VSATRTGTSAASRRSPGAAGIGSHTNVTFVRPFSPRVVPIQNRAARGATEIANLDSDRTSYELEQLRLVVITDVRQTARRVDTAAKQIEAAAAARKAQETNLDAERKRYENGMSTSFEITRIQDDLTAARSRELTAIVGYRTALADYYRATGALVEQAGVVIEDRDPALRRFSFTPGRDEKAYERP